MKTLKRILALTISFIILLAIFANFGEFQKSRSIVEAADLTKTDHTLLSLQDDRLSSGQQAEIQKRTEDQITQAITKRAESDKVWKQQFVIVLIIGTIVMIPFILILGRLLVKSPWYLKPIIGITWTVIMVLIIRLIGKALGW